LDHDDRLAIDFLRFAFLGFDYRVVGRVLLFALLARAVVLVSILRDPGRRRTVPARPFVALRSRRGAQQRHH
jgi:hypothetical protein